jgi:hypothetical protein
MEAPGTETELVWTTRTRRIGWGLALAALLSTVFYLYSNPQLVIMLSDQLWACF